MCAAINVSLACPINRQMSPRNVFALLARRSVRWVGPSDGCCRRTDRPSCIVSALLAGYCTVGLVLYRREASEPLTSGLRLDDVYMYYAVHQQRRQPRHNFQRERVANLPLLFTAIALSCQMCITRHYPVRTTST